MGPLRILIVDDEENIGAFMKTKLSMEAPQFSIEAVESGQACLDYLDTHSADCILSDYQMPGMDGMTLLNKLRGQGNNIPFIFITGQGNEEVASKAFTSGASDYFTKDIGFAHFARIINSVERAVQKLRAEEDKAMAEETLREKDILLSESQRIAHIGSWQFEVPSGLLTWTEETYRIYGVAPETFNLDQDSFYGLIHPGDRPAMREWVRACIAGERPGDLEFRTVLPGGEIRVLNGSGDLHYDAENRPLRLVGTVQDITGRKAAEKALLYEKKKLEDILAGIGDGISIQDTNMVILYQNQAMRDMIGGHVGERCYNAYEKRSDVCDGCPMSESFRDGMTHMAERSAEVGGRVVHVEINTAPLRDADGNITGGIEVVRDITGRKRAEDAFREAEMRQRAILNNIPDIAWLKDSEGRFVAVNEPFGRSCGLPHEELAGKTDLDIWPSELAESYRADDREVMATGKRKLVEEPLEVKDGRRMWIETIKSPVYNDEGDVIGTAGIARDITERKRAEENIAHLNRLYSALSKTSRTVVKATRRNELLEEVCRIVVETAEFRMAWIGIIDEGTRMVKPVASAGFVDGYLDGILISADDVPEGQGPTGTSIRTREHFICPDVETDPRMAPWRDKALERGYLGVAAFPLFADNHRVVGALNVYSGRRQFSGVDELSLLDDLAAEVSYALQHLDEEEARRRAEEALTGRNRDLFALNAVADAITSSRDLEETLKAVLETTLSLGFLEVQNKGVIFLRDVHDFSKLNMAAQVGLAPELIESESSIEMGHCLCGKSAQTGEIIRSGDCFSDPGHTTHYPAMKRHGHIVVPIKSKEDVIGVMTFYLDPDAATTEHQERLLAAIAGQLAVAIDNRRLFENMAAGKKEWEDTFDAIEEAVTIHAPDYTIIRANKAAARLTGLRVDELIGNKCYELFHGLGSAVSTCPARDILSGDALPRTEEVIIGGRPFEVSVYPVMEDGVMTGFVHIAKDVSERKKYERSLKEHIASAMMAADVGSALTTGTDLRSMLQGCAEAVVRHLGAAFARIWTFDEKKNLLELQASAGMYTHIDGRHSRIPVNDRTKIGSIALNRQPHLRNRVIGDPLVGGQEWARREGMAAFAGYPLVVQDRLVGVIAMFAPTELGEAALAALSTVASEVAVGVERQKGAESLQSTNDILTALSRIQARFISDEDPQYLFSVILNELISLTRSEYGFIGEVLHTAEGKPYLKTYAITNIAWDDETRKLYDEHAHHGMEFHNLETLFGAVVASRKPVISNEPSTEPRRGGLPEGLPVLNAFLGLPIYSGSEMVGMAGVANRPGGYSKEVAEYLEPYIAACANIIEAYKNTQLRKRVESALRESEAKFRNVVEQSLVGVYIIQDDLFRYVNPRFAEIFGYGPEEIIDVKSPRDLVFPDDWPMVEKNIRKRESGKVDVLHYSFRGMAKSGEVVHVEIHGSNTFYEGKRAGIGVLMDITESLLAQDEVIRSAQQMATLRQASAQLEEVNRLKSEFLASMSHELRTPLNAVIGLSQVLNEGTYGPLTPKQSEYLTGITESGKHLLSLINDILDLSKIEAGKERLEYSEFNIADTLRKSFMMVKEKAMKHNIELSQDVGPHIGRFYADERRVKQIIFNLLSNAVKFTEPGGKVGLKAAQDEKALSITVWDTGIGIPDDKKHLLFRPFQMLDSSLSRERGGTGLGLVLTKKLTEMHGGTIFLESREGDGTSFTVVLPVIKPAGQELASSKAVALEPGPEGHGATAGKKVMVVEDNHLNMLLAADHLRNSGYEVIEASNGEMAVEKASREKPAIILMDIQMPGIDGFETLERLRRDPAMSGIPVIAMTALAMKGDEDRCMEAGFDDYLSKPVDLGMMVEKVRSHINEDGTG